MRGIAGTYRAIGLMSGTSMDGIDAALLETDGDRVLAQGPWATFPYAEAFRARLAAILGGTGDVAGVERTLTDLHAEAVERLLATAGLAPGAIDVVGFHGQTILHQPALRRTWQIGDGARLARRLGIAVVNDFRSADVAAGGQGAPLVPVYHAVLAAALDKPVAVLNLGGVANVTWIGPDGTLIAFDTGPGNAPLDDWLRRTTGAPFDAAGALAASGRADAARVAAARAHPYFARPAPKSLDRQDFGWDYAAGLGPADGAATLAEITAEAVAAAARHFPAAPLRWIVCGGGRHNRTLMRRLAALLPASVEPAEALGWRGDAIEAEAFALLAVRSLRGQPLTFPLTTGAPRPLAGGRLHPVSAAASAPS